MRPLDAAASSSPSSPDVPAQPAPQPARPDTALAAVLARLAQRFDLRQLRRQTGDDTTPAPVAVAVVERAFQCALPRLDCVAALREAWQRLAFATVGADGPAPAAGAPLPVAVGAVPGVAGVTASLWPAPSSIVAGRRETIAGLGRAAGAPSLWEVASGALIDAGVPPGTVRLTLLGTLELELELELEAVRRPDAEGAAAEPGPVAQTAVAVAAFDLCAGPRGSHGRVRALQPCWPWVEALIGDAGLSEGWRWGDADARDGGDGAADMEGRHDRERAGAGQSAPPLGPQGPQTETSGVRLPRRLAYRRKWQAAWRLIKPGVHAGESDVKLLQLLRQRGLPHDVRFLRKVITAGQAGWLD